MEATVSSKHRMNADARTIILFNTETVPTIKIMAPPGSAQKLHPAQILPNGNSTHSRIPGNLKSTFQNDFTPGVTKPDKVLPVP